MLDEEDSQELQNMPPKAMRKNAIMELVNELLDKSNQSDTKSKKNVTEWGDESEEEDET